MPYTFEITSTLESSQVIARLSGVAGHPAIPVPRELRKQGVRGVDTRVSGTEFRMRLDTRMEWGRQYALRGSVEPLPNQHSRITVTIQLESRPITAPVILGALGVWVLASGSAWGWAMFGAALLLLAVDTAANNRVSPGTNAETRFLHESIMAIAHPGEALASP